MDTDRTCPRRDWDTLATDFGTVPTAIFSSSARQLKKESLALFVNIFTNIQTVYQIEILVPQINCLYQDEQIYILNQV